MSIEAMKQAIENMEWSTPQGREAYWGLVKAIAEAEKQNPVAWELFSLKYVHGPRLQYAKPGNLPKYQDCRPLYTTPQQRTWVDLTEEEKIKLWDRAEKREAYQGAPAFIALIQEVEAKLKEKNT